MFEHIMVDTETLDVTRTAVVLSLGAVEFDPHAGTLGRKYYCRFKHEPEDQPRRTTSQSTVDWWARQSEAARAEAFGGERIPLVDGLFNWLVSFDLIQPEAIVDRYVWANDPGFDCEILRDVFAAYPGRLRWPFGFRQDRSYRTLVDLAWNKGGLMPAKHGVEHNALDDAIGQAQVVCEGYRRLGLAG